MDYKEKIEQLKKSCYGNAPCEIDRERLEAAQIIEGLIRERDAAVNDLNEIMTFGGENIETCKYCINGNCYARNGTKCCEPKWRGVQKEEQ